MLSHRIEFHRNGEKSIQVDLMERCRTPAMPLETWSRRTWRALEHSAWERFFQCRWPCSRCKHQYVWSFVLNKCRASWRNIYHPSKLYMIIVVCLVYYRYYLFLSAVLLWWCRRCQRWPPFSIINIYDIIRCYCFAYDSRSNGILDDAFVQPLWIWLACTAVHICKSSSTFHIPMYVLLAHRIGICWLLCLIYIGKTRPN